MPAPVARLSPERAGYAATGELAVRREAMRQAVAAIAKPTGSGYEENHIAGARVLRFRPAGSPRAILLHVHGGGFRLGCPQIIGSFASSLARACGIEVVCPSYRLAPEHPFPAGLNDLWSVLSALLAGTELPVILSGDSAGGGLVASLAAMTVDQGHRPIGLVLLSPWLDLTVTSDCYDENAAHDPLFSKQSATEAAGMYLQGADARDPLVSPLYGQVSRLPPTFIAFGSGEVLAQDSRSFAAALEQAGVPVRLLEIPGMDHVAVTRSLDLPGAAQSFQALSEFIAELTGRD